LRKFSISEDIILLSDRLSKEQEGEIMRLNIGLFLAAVFLSTHCDNKEQTAASTRKGGALSKSNGANYTSASKASGTTPDAAGAIPDLYKRNVDTSVDTGPDFDTTAYRATTSNVVGGDVDCSVHINRQNGDLCGYDFCGTDADNAYLRPEVYKTVKAIVAQLKKQNLFSSPCDNAAVIKTLQSLTILDLSGNSLTDITPLLNMTGLVDLNLDNNQISDLSDLRNMSSLKILKANYNKLTYLTGIGTDLALTEVYVSNNQIVSIDDAVPLKNLTTLDIANNQVTSITALTDRPIGINITGNPGIITEVATAPIGTTGSNSCATTPGFSGSTTSSPVGCAFNLSYLVLNDIGQNKPIERKTAP
jgi:hypothetical protein